MMRLLSVSTILLMVLCGCDGNLSTDNGMVHVHNHTDMMIRLYYEEEVDIGHGVQRVSRETFVPAGQERTIYVDSLLWDGEVTVEYGGSYQVYDLDFGASGVDAVHVRADDFLVLPSADG